MHSAIRTYRQAQNRTTTECAAKVGVHPVTWRRWELGTSKPNGTHLLAIAQVLGIPAEALSRAA